LKKIYDAWCLVFPDLMLSSDLQGLCPNCIGYMPAGKYDIELKLKNWVGGEDSVVTTIVRGQVPGPKASILGEAKQKSAVSDPLIVQGMASRSVCENADPSPVQYSWTFDPPVITSPQ
jgi:hypothetical protein